MDTDLPLGLSRKESYASLSPADLESMGKRASNMYLCDGISLNEAVTKVAAEHPSISVHQVKRVIEFANTETFQHLFEKQAGDKNVEFDVADPGVILRAMETRVQEHVLTPAPSEYASEPMKLATSDIEADLHLCRVFGMDMATPHSERTSVQLVKEGGVVQRILMGGRAPAAPIAAHVPKPAGVAKAVKPKPVAPAQTGATDKLIAESERDLNQVGQQLRSVSQGTKRVAGHARKVRQELPGRFPGWAAPAAGVAAGLGTAGAIYAMQPKTVTASANPVTEAVELMKAAQSPFTPRPTMWSDVADRILKTSSVSEEEEAVLVRGMMKGQGCGKGMPGGLRRNQNLSACPKGGPGEGRGQGRGKGEYRTPKPMLKTAQPPLMAGPMMAQQQQEEPPMMAGPDAPDVSDQHHEQLIDLERQIELEKKKQELVNIQQKTFEMMNPQPEMPMTPDQAGGQEGAQMADQGQAAQGQVAQEPMAPEMGEGGAEPIYGPNGEVIARGPQMKMASVLTKMAMAHAKTSAGIGNEALLNDLRQATSIDRIKQATSTRPVYPEANPFGELFRTKQKLAVLAEDALHARDSNSLLLKEAEENWRHQIKQHLLNDGNLGQVAHVIDHVNTDDDNVKLAMDNIALVLDNPRFDAVKLQAQALCYEVEKSAHVRVINPNNPLVEAYGALVKVADGQRTLDAAYDELHRLLDEVEAEVRKVCA